MHNNVSLDKKLPATKRKKVAATINNIFDR